MAKKRIGVMTGGGDVPGLNLAIKSVVLNSTEWDYEVMGIRLGWGGLLRYNLDDPESTADLISPLNVNTVRKVDRTGGTFHTSDQPFQRAERCPGTPCGALGKEVKPDTKVTRITS